MTPEQIIGKPIILTEKSTRIRVENKVIFKVARKANKIQIRDAIQKLFDVTVTDVNTMVVRGRERRMGRGHARLKNWKKAIITLREGDEIAFFDTSE
ncbi:MAG: 50S ribosomal protein L23 [Polyangiaceae bacterium]|nr:50S ribosomal protein L23 [Polyangiaceae bacterium]